MTSWIPNSIESCPFSYHIVRYFKNLQNCNDVQRFATGNETPMRNDKEGKRTMDC